MTEVAEKPLPPGVAEDGVGAHLRAYLQRVRGGDLGHLPIIIGILLIAVIFRALNDQFLTANNFVNLMVQMAGLTTLAIGVVFVLLLGEIDLSVGFVSGTGAAVMARLLLAEQPWWVAIGAALLVGLAIGALQGSIIAKIGVPSFVVTLAGFLAWSGAVLILVGGLGTIVVQDRVVVGIANRFLPDPVAWALTAVAVLAYAAVAFAQVRSRTSEGLAAVPTPIVAARVVGVALIGAGAVFWATQGRGVPVVAVIVLVLLVVWSFVANRTRYGRYVYAVGGNAEAARRAGINIDRIRISVFMIASTMAVLGGIILASRLRSVDAAAGGGNLLLNAIAAAVIGGTSLFGGRGRVIDALLGALVIASVDNGMGLLGLSSGVKFVVTGLILLAAVIVDSFSRRGREHAGLA